MRNKFLILSLAAGLIMATAAWAEDLPAGEQNEKATILDPNAHRPEMQSSAESGTGEQVSPQLDTVIQQIEELFGARMRDLKLQIAAAATAEEIEAIEQQAIALKSEWWLALANRQLELARLNQNTELEAEILHSIDAVMNPPAPQATAIEEANESKEGGAN